MAAIHLGSHSPAVRLIAHISDTHFLAGGAALHGRVDTDSTVRQAMEQLERSGLRPDAFVITGDVADRGEPEAYRRVRKIVEATTTRLGAELVWVMGNHDARSAFRAELLDEPESVASADPVDRVIDCGGLRIIALDTSTASLVSTMIKSCTPTVDHSRVGIARADGTTADSRTAHQDRRCARGDQRDDGHREQGNEGRMLTLHDEHVARERLQGTTTNRLLVSTVTRHNASGITVSPRCHTSAAPSSGAAHSNTKISAFRRGC